MIKELQDWAMILSGLAVFGSMCEEILPEGSFQKYIRLGLGMLLVLALLTPITQMIHQEWSMEELGIHHAEEEIGSTEEKQREEILRVYKEKLSQKILSVIQSVEPEFEGEVYCDVGDKEDDFGRIEHVTITSKGEVDAEGIRRIIKQEIELEEERISIRY